MQSDKLLSREAIDELDDVLGSTVSEKFVVMIPIPVARKVRDQARAYLDLCERIAELANDLERHGWRVGVEHTLRALLPPSEQEAERRE